MAITANKTYVAGEVLQASDLNSSLTQIINAGGGDLGSPRTADFSLAGYQLVLNANGDTTITQDTGEQIDFMINGTDRIVMYDEYPWMTINGKRVLTHADRLSIDASLSRLATAEARLAELESDALTISQATDF